MGTFFSSGTTSSNIGSQLLVPKAYFEKKSLDFNNLGLLVHIQFFINKTIFALTHKRTTLSLQFNFLLVQ